MAAMGHVRPLLSSREALLCAAPPASRVPLPNFFDAGSIQAAAPAAPAPKRQVLGGEVEHTIPRFARHQGPTVASIWLARWRRLERLDRSPDPHPGEPPLVIAAVEHPILKAGGFKLGVGAVLPD